MISLVVPAYNHGRYLAECLDSILAQGHAPTEIVVVDDGSTDETPAVLHGYRNRVRVERQENRGQSAALNRGWQLARGEVLGYVSADDVLLPGALEAAWAALEADPDLSATYCDFVLVDEESRPLRRVRTPDCDRTTMVSQLVTVAGPGCCFRRRSLERVGGWDPSFRQNPDLDFLLRLGLDGPLRRIPQVLAGYRVHDTSQTHRLTSPRRAEEPIAIVHKLFARDDLPAEWRPLREAALATAHVVAARQHLRARRWSAAGRHLGIAGRTRTRSLLSLRAARLVAGAFRA